MRRRLFKLASVAWLFLCAATVLLWVRSYFVADEFTYLTASAPSCRCYDCFLVTSHGQVAFDCTIRQLDMPEALGMVLDALQQRGSHPGLSWYAFRPARPFNPEGKDSPLRRLGFLWGTRNDAIRIAAITNSDGVHRLTGKPARGTVPKPLGKITFSGFHFRVPLWFIVGLLIPPTLPSLVRRCRRWMIRAKRAKRGRCPICSYSLTGNTSGTCPECGTAILPPAKTPETESPRPA